MADSDTSPALLASLLSRTCTVAEALVREHPRLRLRDGRLVLSNRGGNPSSSSSDATTCDRTVVETGEGGQVARDGKDGGDQAAESLSSATRQLLQQLKSNQDDVVYGG